MAGGIETRLILIAISNAIIWGLAGGAASLVRGRTDLERRTLRTAVLMALMTTAVLLAGITWAETPALLTPVVVRTPAAVQTAIEDVQPTGILRLVLLGWSGVAFVLLALLAVQLLRSRVLLRRSRPIPLPSSPTSSRSGSPVRVHETAVLASPATIGRTVLLPVDWRTLAPGELQALLVHEYGHAVRQDFWWLLVARVHHALFWWNPLCQWAIARLARLGEQQSDDDVLQSGIDGNTYAGLLMRYVRPPTALGVGLASTTLLLERLDRILQRPCAPGARTASPGVRRLWTGATTALLSLPAVWADSMLAEVQHPLRFVLLEPHGTPLQMAGSHDDLRQALAAAGDSPTPVLWYARGSRVRVDRTACATSAALLIHRNARPDGRTTDRPESVRTSATLVQQTRHLIRRVEQR